MRLGIKKRDASNGSNIDIFRRRMSNLFDDFFSLEPTGFFESDWVPSIDVHEDSKGIYIKADIPGIDEKDLRVDVENNVLSIKGEKREERRSGDEARTLVMERKYGSFQRSIRLPEGAKADGIDAKFKHGVLIINIPREKTEEPKKIKINIS